MGGGGWGELEAEVLEDQFSGQCDAEVRLKGHGGPYSLDICGLVNLGQLCTFKHHDTREK